MNGVIFTLMFWVTGCCFDDCPIKAYEVHYDDSIELCEQRLKAWRNIRPENRGECLPGRKPSWEELLELTPIQDAE